MEEQQADGNVSANEYATETVNEAAVAEGPGRVLAAAREQRGMSVTEVAMRLKFAPRQIEALEADQYDKLPGRAIVRGMVRNYARLLEIDADPLVAELERRLQPSPNTVQPVDMRIPIKESRKEGRALLVMSVIVLLAVVGFALDWYLSDRGGEAARAVPQAEEQAPAAQAQPAEAPAGQADEAEPAVQAPEDAPAPAAEPVAAVAADTAAVRLVSTESRTALPAAPEPAAEAAPPVPDADQPLRMRFSDEVWVEVKDGQGRILASRLAPAGSTLALDGTAPFSLVLGKAEAVALEYKGQPVDLAPYARAGVARLTLE